MSTIRALMDEARRLGVSVQLAHLDGDLLGLYDHDNRQITVDLALTLPLRKDTLAHELGHAFYGDDCSTSFRERRADKHAARLLIDPRAYRDAELIDPDPSLIALELGQSRRMVRVFQREWLPTLALTRDLREQPASA